MTRWEYKMLNVPDDRWGDLEELLNEAGAEGWEAIGFTQDTGYSVKHLMKRPSNEPGNDEPKPELFVGHSCSCHAKLEGSCDLCKHMGCQGGDPVE